MGNYLIGILVIASVLKSELQTDKNQSTSIALYNEYEKKISFVFDILSKIKLGIKQYARN